MPDFVIVGAALAGAKAAEKLREEGFEGRIVLIGNETELPYERPPLSKDYLRREADRAAAHVHPGFYDEHDIELRLGTTVERVDAAANAVVLAGGETIGYDRLLLTPGAEPRRLDLPGADLDGVLYLRTMDDSDAIAARIKDGARLVVVGAGWIGAEVGASAKQGGADVTIVERASVPLEHVLGRELGEFYAQVHRDHGVDLRAGAELSAFEGDGRVERVVLKDGTLDCDFVVVGVGIAPRAALAESAGAKIDNGVLVSASLQSSVEGVFAAGDVANAFHPFYDRHLRVEHWANALHQPEVAAKAMLGKPASYERLPYFFSDQYDVGMEYTGYATEWDEVVYRGDRDAREFIAFWIHEGRVVAGMNVNVWDVVDTVGDLIRSKRQVDLTRLRDTDVPLGEV